MTLITGQLIPINVPGTPRVSLMLDGLMNYAHADYLMVDADGTLTAWKIDCEIRRLVNVEFKLMVRESRSFTHNEARAISDQ